MKLQYLGTAAAEGIPALFCQCTKCKQARKVLGKEYRTRSGAVINDKLMIDFPPDVYATCLRVGVDLPEISHVIFTHSHQDHLDMADLMMRSSPVFCSRLDQEPLHLYGNDQILPLLQQERGWESAKNDLVFTQLEPFCPVEIAGITVTALKAKHTQPPEQGYFYLLEQDGKRLLYAHDTAIFPEENFEYLAGKPLDLVSFDCTNGVLKMQGTHMSLWDNALVKERLIALGCGKADTIWVVNHFSHNGLRWPETGEPISHEEFEAEAQKFGMTVSYDGRVFEF